MAYHSIHRLGDGRARIGIAGFEEMDQVPKMFVLMGDFQSYSCNTASVDHVAIRDNFRQLASLIAKYHRLRVCGFAPDKAITFVTC